MAQLVKNPPAMQETACNPGAGSSILGSGSSPGEGNNNLLQYSCLKNPMGRSQKNDCYSLRGGQKQIFWHDRNFQYLDLMLISQRFVLTKINLAEYLQILCFIGKLYFGFKRSLLNHWTIREVLEEKVLS